VVGTATDHFLMFCPKWSDGKARMIFANNGQTGSDQIVLGGRMSDFRWVHVALTLAGNVATLYLDGAVAGTNADMRFQPVCLGATTQNWIGRSCNAGNPLYGGLVDDFRTHHGAIGAAEVAALATAWAVLLRCPGTTSRTSQVPRAGAGVAATTLRRVRGEWRARR
jgi:Concanavalin A-like lectin/glucanases superfamily